MIWVPVSRDRDAIVERSHRSRLVEVSPPARVGVNPTRRCLFGLNVRTRLRQTRRKIAYLHHIQGGLDPSGGQNLLHERDSW